MPAGHDASGFYDQLAELCHLVYTDWEASIEKQARLLSGILRERWRPCVRVLDAACGIDTQALGLSQAGFEVTASDIPWRRSA